MLGSNARSWLALWLQQGLGPKRILEMVEKEGDIERVVSMSEKELVALGLPPAMAAQVATASKSIRLDEELTALERFDLNLLTYDSPSYPKLLKEIPYAPPILYQKGKTDLNEGLFLAFVGSRKASFAGKSQCRRLIEALAKLHPKVVVVSGLALGIDAAAHEAAMEFGLKTVAVMAGGLSEVYPRQNQRLAERIIEEGGSWLTEFPIYTQPLAQYFPVRNRVISGMSRGVMVVEAGERSGASITANYALEQGRELFAFPGPPDSKFSLGTNRMIQRGAAKLVLGAEDILEEFDASISYQTTMDEVPLRVGTGTPQDVSEAEATVLELLEEGGQHQDHLAQRSGLPMPSLLAALTTLEMKGLIHQRAGSVFERS